MSSVPMVVSVLGLVVPVVLMEPPGQGSQIRSMSWSRAQLAAVSVKAQLRWIVVESRADSRRDWSIDSAIVGQSKGEEEDWTGGMSLRGGSNLLRLPYATAVTCKSR